MNIVTSYPIELDLLLYENGINTVTTQEVLMMPENRHLTSFNTKIPTGTIVYIPKIPIKPVKTIINLWD